MPPSCQQTSQAISNSNGGCGGTWGEGTTGAAGVGATGFAAGVGVFVAACGVGAAAGWATGRGGAGAGVDSGAGADFGAASAFGVSTGAAGVLALATAGGTDGADAAIEGDDAVAKDGAPEGFGAVTACEG